MLGICGVYAIIKLINQVIKISCICNVQSQHIQSICLLYTLYLFYLYIKEALLPIYYPPKYYLYILYKVGYTIAFTKHMLTVCTEYAMHILSIYTPIRINRSGKRACQCAYAKQTLKYTRHMLCIYLAHAHQQARLLPRFILIGVRIR